MYDPWLHVHLLVAWLLTFKDVNWCIDAYSKIRTYKVEIEMLCLNVEVSINLSTISFSTLSLILCTATAKCYSLCYGFILAKLLWNGSEA